jgi:hypothetical protein
VKRAITLGITPASNGLTVASTESERRVRPLPTRTIIREDYVSRGHEQNGPDRKGAVQPARVHWIVTAGGGDGRVVPAIAVKVAETVQSAMIAFVVYIVPLSAPPHVPPTLDV